MSSNPIHGEEYSIQHYVIKFVSDDRSVVISIAFHMYDEDGNNALSKEEVVDMIQVCIM
jgi:hypothetical protein